MTNSGKVTTVFIAVIVTLCIATTFLSGHAQGSVADELWNKYRVKLIEMLTARYPQYAPGLQNFGSNTDIGQTVLHIITDPSDAQWHTHPANLNEYAGYVPSWKTAWETRKTTDNTVAEKYKSMLFSLTNRAAGSQLFAQFQKAPKSFAESPHHEKLGAFITRTQSAAPNAFHFVVEEGSGSVSIGGPWGTKTSAFSHMSSIVRELKKGAGAVVMWDSVFHEEESEMDEDDQLLDDMWAMIDEDEDTNVNSDSHFFRRRRRRRSPPPVVQQPIHIASKKFHMDMKAAGLIGIPVRPNFIDRNAIRANRANFKGNWFDANGQFNLIPSIIWVAMRPHVVLRLSESEFTLIQKSWGSSLGLATGGVFFRNNNFRQALSDPAQESVLNSMFSEEMLNKMRENNDLQDSATFTITSTNEMGDEVILQEGLLEDYQDLSDANDMLASQLDEDTLALEMDEQLAESQFFRRRRRRRPPPPPPPPPPPIVEKVYQATFQSNSLLPQIIAVTSDIL